MVFSKIAGLGWVVGWMEYLNRWRCTISNKSMTKDAGYVVEAVIRSRNDSLRRAKLLYVITTASFARRKDQM